MKKILFLLVMVTAFVACSDDDNKKPKDKELDISKIAGLIDVNVQKAKEILGKPRTETTTLGKVQLSYLIETEEGDYIAILNFNADNILYEISATLTDKKKYSDAINFAKSLSDRIQNLYSDKFYTAMCLKASGNARFTNRSEFWEYIADNTLTGNFYENWSIQNGGTELIYEDIQFHFDFSDNSMYILVTKDKW